MKEIIKNKVNKFFWEDVREEHWERVRYMEKDQDYNKGVEQLIKMRDAETNERLSKKMDKTIICTLISSGIQLVSVGAGVWAVMVSYAGDHEMVMSNGKAWNFAQKALTRYNKS